MSADLVEPDRRALVDTAANGRAHERRLHRRHPVPQRALTAFQYRRQGLSALATCVPDRMDLVGIVLFVTNVVYVVYQSSGRLSSAF